MNRVIVSRDLLRHFFGCLTMGSCFRWECPHPLPLSRSRERGVIVGRPLPRRPLLSLLLVLAAMGIAASATGGEAPAERRQVLIPTLESVSPANIQREFTLAPFGVEHQVRLSLEARIDWKQLAGSNPWIRVAVNGNLLARDDLLNKRNEFKLRSGVDLTWFHHASWRVLYSPDFEQAIKNVKHPNACPEADPYRYVWNITPYVKPGQNVLRIDNLQVLARPTALVLRNVAVEVGRPLSPPPDEAVSAAPTGPLPEFVARGPQKVAMEVRLSHAGGFRLAVAGQRFTLVSRFSLPEGKQFSI